jgi:type I restriction enzyme M protein
MKRQQQSESLEQKVKKFAKSMANRVDVSKYLDPLSGLLFLRCACDISPGEVKSNFKIPEESSWAYLRGNLNISHFDGIVTGALKEFEGANGPLKGLLAPHPPGKAQFPPGISTHIFRFVDSLPLDSFQGVDFFARIYEYLHAGNKKDGQFFTPDCVARLLVEILQPDGGRIYDPSCGTGTMFIHAINHVKANGGNLEEISVYGQEANTRLHRICRLNLALRGIDHSNIHWNSDGSLLHDALPHLKADYILANPPFNDRDWGGEELKDDPRWLFGTPPPGNGNFAWLQNVISHMTPGGKAGVLLSYGSLSSRNASELEIRKRLAESGLVDCVMGLPDRLFFNTPIPPCVWLLSGP